MRSLNGLFYHIMFMFLSVISGCIYNEAAEETSEKIGERLAQSFLISAQVTVMANLYHKENNRWPESAGQLNYFCEEMNEPDMYDCALLGKVSSMSFRQINEEVVECKYSFGNEGEIKVTIGMPLDPNLQYDPNELSKLLLDRYSDPNDLKDTPAN